MKIIKTTIEADSSVVISEINAIFRSLKKVSPDRTALFIIEIKKELAIKATELQIADYLVGIGGNVKSNNKGKYFLTGWFKPFWVLSFQSKGRDRFLAEKSHAAMPYGTESHKALLEWSKTTEKDSVKFGSEKEAIDFRNSEMAAWHNVKIYQYADFE
jgi:hypothetical protein